MNLNLYIGAWWYILENFLDKFLLVYSISTYHIFGILLSLSPVMGEQVAAHNGRELKSNMIGLVYGFPKINSFSLMLLSTSFFPWQIVESNDLHPWQRLMNWIFCFILNKFHNIVFFFPPYSTERKEKNKRIRRIINHITKSNSRGWGSTDNLKPI